MVVVAAATAVAAAAVAAATAVAVAAAALFCLPALGRRTDRLHFAMDYGALGPSTL